MFGCWRRGGRARLAQEARRAPPASAPSAERHDLQRHVAVERLVAAAVDDAHRALAQEVQHAIAADLPGQAHAAIIADLWQTPARPRPNGLPRARVSL